PQTQQGQDAAPDQGDGDQARQQPRLDLGELLAPTAPAQPPRSTDGPDLGDLDEVTEPLTEPLTGPLTGPLDPPLEETTKRPADGRRSLDDGLGGLL
ncbi:MAG: hypothetical protein M3211_11410, partial [Actinomycetota bacterium]|nr:hypothetical protein [Actinomycetota bacterium]